MSFGITNLGFIKKSKEQIRNEQVILFRDKLGQDIDLTPSTFEGQLLDITVENLYQLWNDFEKHYYSIYNDTAEGVQLDRINIGIKRRPAISASVVLVFTGTNGTTIPINFLTQTANGIVFETIESKQILGNTFVNCQAIITGSTGIVSENSIIEIVNPISGIDTVNNPLPSSGGLEIESDLDFRLRAKSISISGESSISRIKQEIDLIQGVSNSRVFENVNSFYVNGIPPHSLEVIVSGGRKEEIALAIYRKKSNGIESVSSWIVNIDNQIKIKSKIKGTVYIRLVITLITGNTGYFKSYGNFRSSSIAEFKLYIPSVWNYNQLKNYIDSDTELSRLFFTEITGDGVTTVNTTFQEFKPDIENTVDFEDEFGNVQKIQFSKSNNVFVIVTAKIKRNINWLDSNENKVTQNLVQTIGGIYNSIIYNGLNVGEPVQEWKLISALNSISGIDDVDFFMSFKPSIPVSNNQLDIQTNEQAKILQGDVLIQYV